MGTLKPQSKEQLYSHTTSGTLAVDERALKFGTNEEGTGGGVAARPGPSSLYQMQQPTHQRLVCQLHIIRCGTII